MYYDIEVIDLYNDIEKNNVKNFLNRFDLQYDKVDYTVVIKEDNNIIGTCSKKKNIVKCFAIDDRYQGEGISNLLISKISNKLFEEGLYNNFVFTKCSNTYLFESLGYKEIMSTEKVSLLETGNKNINSYLNNLKNKYNIDTTKKHTALVMNCNPFTLGHRHIIEKASIENENVIVFIVEEDESEFSFRDRYNLVKEGVSDLENVCVVEGGEYIISNLTFPSYFLKKEDDKLKEYINLDVNIFGKYFTKDLNINKRYVGEEVYCKLTNRYNEGLLSILPNYGVEVCVINRKEVDDKAISASMVRSLLRENQFDIIKKLVPKVTFDFLFKMKMGTEYE